MSTKYRPEIFVSYFFIFMRYLPKYFLLNTPHSYFTPYMQKYISFKYTLSLDFFQISFFNNLQTGIPALTIYSVFFLTLLFSL